MTNRKWGDLEVIFGVLGCEVVMGIGETNPMAIGSASGYMLPATAPAPADR